MGDYEEVLLVVKGNKDAFVRLIEKNKNLMYRMAFIYVKNEEDALDIVSEAVCKALISIKKLKSPEFFNSWIIKIIINSSIDYINRGKKKLPLNEDVAISSVPSSEEFLDLYSAIDRLEEKYKTVIVLRYFEDLKLSEISQILECPVNTVKTHIHKALKILKIELGEEDKDE